MPNEIVDFDGCGDGDRSLQANDAWSGSFYSVSTSFGAFGYGTQILQGGSASRAFTPLAHPLIGWHMNTRIWDNPNTGHEVRFREGTLVCATMKFPNSGKVQVYDAGGVLRGETVALTWPFQAWAYIEVSLLVDNGLGSVKVWLFGNNDVGSPDLDVTSIDTLPVSGTGVCNNMQWHGIAGNSHWIDDWYLVDGSLSSIGLGGLVIDGQSPNGDDLAEWTPSGGGGNFAQVDERPFSATDNVSSAVDGAKDRYTIAPSGNDAEVFAVRVIGQMKKTDVDITKARLHITDDGTQGNGVTRTLLTTTKVYADTFNERPSDSSDWDEASVNALLIGPERIAP